MKFITKRYLFVAYFRINVHVQRLDTTKDKTEAQDVDSLL